MNAHEHCAECGAEIISGGPGGLCAKCLFGLGLGAGPGLEVVIDITAESSGSCTEPGDLSPGPQEPRGGIPVEANNPISVTNPLTEKPGDRIGPYKLLQQIGEGGFGVVYMAQQREPVRRRVALKIVKLGMDTRQVVARFDAERQALALMNHPNIARILDAGATPTGRPYFVMELVEGVRMTEYCDQNKLSIRERVDLFVQVCRAVQHAHQKGIIHRDLKPSNILVTLHDGVPVPKVIDFGIAKATQLELTEQTVFTHFGQFIGTPAYVSPEQAGMSGLDIDTRSDIYSLGVLLYELLTGTTPFETQELLKAGLEGMREIISHRQPPRPSTRLTQKLAAKGANTAANAKVRNQKPRISSDLDWIVMRCLEKDRTRRYETANGLAADIARHLNQEPVVARPPSKLYRFQKLVRRNRLAFSAATAITILLIASVLTTTWLALRAKAQATKSQQVVQLLNRMLAGVGPAKARGKDTAMLKGILDETAAGLSKELPSQPEVEAELRTTIGEVYLQLGEYEPAETALRRALSLRQKLFGAEHGDVAASLNDVAVVLCERGKYREAEEMQRKALAMRKKILGEKDRAVAVSLNNLAQVLSHEDKPKEAEELYRKALALREELLGVEDPGVAETLNGLGVILDKEYDYTNAEAPLRRALQIQTKVLGAHAPEVAATINDIGIVLFHQGNLDEAERSYNQALEIEHILFGNEHPDIARTLSNLAAVRRKRGKLTDAEELLRKGLEMRRKLQGSEHAEVAYTLNLLATVLGEENKLDQAEPLAREAVTIRHNALGEFNTELDISINNLGQILQREKKFTEVQTLYHEELPGMRARLTSGDPRLADALSILALACLSEKKFVEAEPCARECLAILERTRPNDPKIFSTRCLLGSSLLGQKRYADAEPLLLSGYEGIQQHHGNDPKARTAIKRTLALLVELYEGMDQPDKAAQWKQKVADMEPVKPEKTTGP